MKQSTIVGLVIGATVLIGAAVGYSIWCKRDAWDPKHGDTAISGLTDDYNESIKEFPTDNLRAAFAFDVRASKRLTEFAVQYSHHPEYIEWAKTYARKQKDLRKAIEKA